MNTNVVCVILSCMGGRTNVQVIRKWQSKNLDRLHRIYYFPTQASLGRLDGAIRGASVVDVLAGQRWMSVYSYAPFGAKSR